MRNSLECDASLLSIALVAFAQLPLSQSISLSLFIATRALPLYGRTAFVVSTTRSLLDIIIPIAARWMDPRESDGFTILRSGGDRWVAPREKASTGGPVALQDSAEGSTRGGTIPDISGATRLVNVPWSKVGA